MKFRVISLAAVLLGCIHAKPLEVEANGNQVKVWIRIFEDSLRALMETVREIVYNGSDTIPVLDPFIDDNHRSVSLDIDEVNLEAEFENIKAVGIGGFIVNDINFVVLRRRFDFSFTVPSVQIAAESYKAKGSLNGSYAIEGHGKAEVIFHNLTIAGFATVIPRDGFLFMDNCQIELDLKDFTSKIENLVQAGSVSDFINSVIENLVLEAVQVYKLIISSFINDLVTDTANKYLGDITLGDLIDLIS